MGKTRKIVLKSQLGPWWRATRKHAISWILCHGWILCPREAFPVLLLFLSNMKLPSLRGTHCSHHRIFLPGSTNTGSFLYPDLSRKFISWRFPPRFQFGWSWPAGTQVIRWEAWWSHKLFFLSKIGQKGVYLRIPNGIQIWLRWRAHLFPEHQETSV